MKSMKKTIAALVAISMIFGCVIGGTIAWLTHTSGPVVNTFTDSNVEVTLTETTGTDYQMVPGKDIDKDPTVAVSADSEDCYVFVKVTKAPDVTTFDNYLTYTIAGGWELVNGENDVYYRVVKKADTSRSFAVLEGNQVSVKTTVTKEMMNAINDGTVDEPTLTFQAYAIQKDYLKDGSNTTIDNAAGAWALLDVE